jgi:hypothetical protein
VALLAAALLAACGGSSSDSSSSSEADPAGSTTTNTTAQSDPDESGSGKGASQGQGNDQGQNSGQGNESQAQQDGGGSSPENVATPLKVSGGGSEQFRSKGGDNSIQEYGEESDESELQEVAEVVHGFYVARAQEEWGKACSYLAKSNIEQLEQLASQSPEFKGGCAPILEAFTRPLAASVEREITTVDAGSFRHDGEQGFLVYYGADHTAYAMPLRDEDGSWKIAALSGTTLG